MSDGAVLFAVLSHQAQCSDKATKALQGKQHLCLDAADISRSEEQAGLEAPLDRVPYSGLQHRLQQVSCQPKLLRQSRHMHNSAFLHKSTGLSLTDMSTKIFPDLSRTESIKSCIINADLDLSQLSFQASLH